jgi:hypothetical protein
LTEVGKEPSPACFTCKGEWRAGSDTELARYEITNGIWEDADTLKARWGQRAPYLTKLRIQDAFLDPQSNERIPFDKRHWAVDIHQFGWS